MSDTYGSGLTFTPDAPPGMPSPDASASPMPNDGPALAVQPTGAPQGASPDQPSFGSSLKNMIPGPHYTAPDPQLSPLDQSASLLDQRVKRANSVATNPLLQLFAPEQVQAARDFVPKAAEQLQKIEQQKSAIQAGRVQAQTLGLSPGEASDQATAEDRVTIASAKALKGDMKAFQGIQAVAPDKAAAIAPQVYETVAGHLTKAQLAFDSLASMQNEGQYRAKVNQLRQDGTLTDLESLGMKLPPTFEAFSAAKASEGRALREARIGVNAIGQKLEERNTYQPMEKNEAETYKGRLTTPYGDDISGGTWSRNGASGTRGKVVNGIATADDLGKGGMLGDATQRKELGEDMARLVPKEELEKFRAFNRTYELAKPNEEQKKHGDTVNTNPNVQQGIAEGLATMLRGGYGGATGQLIKIETGKRGVIQGVIDKIKTEYAGTVNEIGGKDIRPYLTHLTQDQMREVLDGLKQLTDRSIDDRALQTARRAGALGFDASALGLGKNEANGAIADAIEEGRKAQVERMRPTFQPIGGGDGVLQLGAQRPGAGSSALPGGAQQANQLPGAQPLATPVQQANGQPPAPGGPSPVTPQTNPGQPTNGGVQQPPPSPAPGQTGGGGQPVTVAGQQVTLPPGITPAYAQAVQHVESGNERDPWKAGTKNSSASGAFQFIDSTWKDNKPSGAPDRAKDATPAQQAEALATLTTKNTGALQANRLPVTDTNLYVMHNLGAGAGATLLQADKSADARSLVGEAAARNNPMFFKGRPTVATVLQRYQDAMNGAPDGGEGFAQRATRLLGQQPSESITPEQGRAIGNAATEYAPAIGSTVGSLIGSRGGVLGSMAGGAVGGGAGQALKDYLQGTPQRPAEIAKQTVLGGALGVGGLPRGLNMLARAVGAGGVEAGAEAVKGSDVGEVAGAGLTGAGEALGGEAFGHALGMAGHKVYSMFAPDARKAVQAAAKDYAEATKTLETQQPKITSGTTSIENPEYMAAEVKKTKAETTLKDAGLAPEEAAYAHKVSSEGVPKQEAQAAKPGAQEQQRIGAGYQQIQNEVGSTGVGAPKASPKLADGPVAAVEAKKVSASHAELADHVEMAITAPAKNWEEKWTQLKEARSDLLQAERDAMSSTAPGRTKTAADMRTLADTVRKQQEKAATYVFGPVKGAEVMQRLKVLDVRYRNLMEATNGGDIVKAAAMKNEAGREADRKFRAFAHDDPVALSAWAAMRREGPNLEKDVKNLVAIERVPVLGKLYSAVKLMGSLNSWIASRAAGSPAKFSDFIKQGDSGARATRDVVGTAASRGAVQGGGNFSALNPVSSASAAEVKPLPINPPTVLASGGNKYVQRADGRWMQHDKFGPVGLMPVGWSPQ